MRHYRLFASASLSAALLLGPAVSASAQFYQQRNLVSDGAVPAPVVDPLLVNAWGLTSSPTSPWWVADNGSGFSTLYNGAGQKMNLNVMVPGAPTGVVFNGGTGFVINQTAPARFIFASEDEHDLGLEWRNSGRRRRGPIGRRCGVQGARDRLDDGRRLHLCDEFPCRVRRGLRLDVPADAVVHFHRFGCARRLCPVRHPEHRRNPVRHVRAAGRRRT